MNQVFITALPDGRYVCNVGPKNTVLWTDPEDPQCYMMYDERGVLSSVVDWSEDGPYAGAYAKDEYVANGLMVAHPRCLKWKYESMGMLEPGDQMVWNELLVMNGD